MAEKSKSKSNGGSKDESKRFLRSRLWFDNPDNPGMTALYIERYLNFGLTPGRAALGQADHRHRPDRLRPFAVQSPSSRARQARARRHHARPAAWRSSFPSTRSRRRASGRPRRSTAISPISASSRFSMAISSTAWCSRPGCDKTTPACIMAAATVNMPAIVLSGGPMNNGWHHGERTGSGTIVWKARAELAEGKIDYEQFMEIVTSSAPSVGHCNTMGTASTMNALAEALGMSLPGCAAIPAPHRERGQIAYETGKRIVEHGVGGPEALRHPDARGVRERDRRQQRDRRLDQRADPHQRHRPPHRRQARHRGLGEGRPSRCRCSSTCSRPANISARSSIAPAACRRWSTS